MPDSIRPDTQDHSDQETSSQATIVEGSAVPGNGARPQPESRVILTAQDAKKPGYPPLPPRKLDSTGIEEAYYRLYREFFDMAEKRRRWSLADDIPWDQVSNAVSPEIANVVEVFCAVELYLPDYIAQILPVIRASRGRAWFHANWGYEESKHSMALGDWLLRSGHRTEEQMADMEQQLFGNEWNLPYGSPLGMVLYAMTQELATWLHYRNLRNLVGEKTDPALFKALTLISTDERAHHDFYRRVAQIYLEHDRQGTLELMREVFNNFAMPAVYFLAESKQSQDRIRSLNIFNEEIYYKDVLRPILDKLGVNWSELRQRKPGRKSSATTGMRS